MQKQLEELRIKEATGYCIRSNIVAGLSLLSILFDKLTLAALLLGISICSLFMACILDDPEE